MQNREHWGSKLGFILAAAGSAVGIGNIWKYPHMAGQNGGAAFTLVYLLCILVVGLSIVIAEFAIGRKTQLSPVGAFEMLAPGSNWKWVGFLGVASAFVILSFYGVVGGWIMKYVTISLTGGFEVLKNDPEAAEVLFGSFVSSTWGPVVWQVLFMAICVYVIVNGVKGGIEKWSKIMMPLIILLLIVLAVRGLTLPNGSEGITFLFQPKFEDLNASSIVLALGHSFFTLSLGMGTMITYGSYLDKDQNLLSSALWVIFLDTAIAMLAGVAGALYVPQVGIINPSEFSPLFSIEIVVWVALGGRATLYGAVIGALLVNYAKTVFTGIMPDAWLFALGALFVLVTVFLPKGIAGLLQKRRQTDDDQPGAQEATA